MKKNKPTDAELRGMTVNERLFAVGLIDQWDKAAKKRNRARMIEILGKCALTNEQCKETTDAVLKKPDMYGYRT